MTKKNTSSFSEEEASCFGKALERFHQSPEFLCHTNGEWRVHQAVIVTLADDAQERVVHLFSFKDNDRPRPTFCFSATRHVEGQQKQIEYYLIVRGYRRDAFTRVPLGILQDLNGGFLSRSTRTNSNNIEGVLLRACILDHFMPTTGIAMPVSPSSDLSNAQKKQRKTLMEFVELAQADHILRVIRKKREKFRRHKVTRPSTFYVLRTLSYDNQRLQFYKARGDEGCKEDEGDDGGMDRFHRIADEMERDQNHPWNVLNTLCRDPSLSGSNIESDIHRVVKQLEEDKTVVSRFLGESFGSSAGEDHRTKLVREQLPHANMHVTPYWLAAEQSQDSASIPSMKLYQPQIVTHPHTGKDRLCFTQLR